MYEPATKGAVLMGSYTCRENNIVYDKPINYSALLIWPCCLAVWVGCGCSKIHKGTPITAKPMDIGLKQNP